MSRAIYIPTVQIPLLRGNPFTIRDYSNAAYVDLLDTLIFDYVYLLEECFIGYPELLSFKLYNNMDYWDFLLMYNGIMDWYDGMSVGMALNIPTLQSMENMKTAMTQTKSNVNTFVTI